MNKLSVSMIPTERQSKYRTEHPRCDGCSRTPSRTTAPRARCRRESPDLPSEGACLDRALDTHPGTDTVTAVLGKVNRLRGHQAARAEKRSKSNRKPSTPRDTSNADIAATAHFRTSASLGENRPTGFRAHRHPETGDICGREMRFDQRFFSCTPASASASAARRRAATPPRPRSNP